jgi:hypothetical protein
MKGRGIQGLGAQIQLLIGVRMVLIAQKSVETAIFAASIITENKQ